MLLLPASVLFCLGDPSSSARATSQISSSWSRKLAPVEAFSAQFISIQVLDGGRARGSCRGRSVTDTLLPRTASASPRFPTGDPLLRVLLLPSVAPHKLQFAEQETAPPRSHTWLQQSFGCSPVHPSGAGYRAALNQWHFQQRQRQNSPIRQTAAHSGFKFCLGGKCVKHTEMY